MFFCTAIARLIYYFLNPHFSGYKLDEIYEDLMDLKHVLNDTGNINDKDIQMKVKMIWLQMGPIKDKNGYL